VKSSDLTLIITLTFHLLPFIFRGLLGDVPVIKFYITSEFIVHIIPTGHFSYSTAFLTGKVRHAWRRAMLLTYELFACIHKSRLASQEFGLLTEFKPVRLIWSGLVWSGLVWSGLVWSGLVWSGLLECSCYHSQSILVEEVLWSQFRPILEECALFCSHYTLSNFLS
jgi:hypothetical protein